MVPQAGARNVSPGLSTWHRSRCWAASPAARVPLNLRIGPKVTAKTASGARGNRTSDEVNSSLSRPGPSSASDGAGAVNTSASPTQRATAGEHFPCRSEGCDRAFTTKAGASLHMKRAHPSLYEQLTQGTEKSGSGGRVWTTDERVALAKSELRWEQLAVKPRGATINSWCWSESGLKKQGRTFDSVKSQRKSTVYKRLVEEERARAEQAPGLETVAETEAEGDEPEVLEEVAEVDPVGAVRHSGEFGPQVPQHSDHVSAVLHNGFEIDDDYCKIRKELIHSVRDTWIGCQLGDSLGDMGPAVLGVTDESEFDRQQKYVGELFVRWLEEQRAARREHRTSKARATPAAFKDDTDGAQKQTNSRPRAPASTGKEVSEPRTTLDREQGSSGGTASRPATLPARKQSHPRGKDPKQSKATPTPRDCRDEAKRKGPKTQLRERLRAKVMSSFRKSPYPTAKRCVSGEFSLPAGGGDPPPGTETGPEGTPRPGGELEGLHEFWGPLFEQPSVEDRRRFREVPVRWSILSPVRPAEVAEAVKSSPDNTPGPDGVDKEMLKWIMGRNDLVGWFNLFLLMEGPVGILCKGRITLVPKVEKPAVGSDYRPITVLSKVLRIFHSILVKRFQSYLKLEPWQRGFRLLDGCRDNVWAIKNLIKCRRTAGKPLCLAWLDVKNAFGSVSHESIIKALQRKGVPRPLLAYVLRLYGQASVSFKGTGNPDQLYSVNCGVLQGDPLSAEIFIHVMDMAMEDLDPRIGFGPDTGKTSHLAYADDDCLIAESQLGIEQNVSVVVSSFGRCGMKLNARKCGTLTLKSTRKTKKCFVDEKPFLSIEGSQVPALGLAGTYRYLGLNIGAFGAEAGQARRKLLAGLDNVKRVPCDPQSKMFTLREVLIPQVIHQLVLGDSTGKGLRDIDRAVRKWVREVTHLPHDLPLGAYHAKIRDGGLGIPSLETEIPRWRADRLLRLTQPHPKIEWPSLIPWLLEQDNVQSRFSKDTSYPKVKKVGDPTTNIEIRTRQDSVDYWKARLTTSVDGWGLKTASLSRESSMWVRSPAGLIRGGEYVKMLAVRFATLKTPLRASRGSRGLARANASNCNMCSVPGSLSHILQVCGKTHGMRTLRHNEACKVLARSAELKGWSVHREPQILPNGELARTGRTLKSSLKPDLILAKGNKVLVVDPTIVADNARFVDQNRAKIRLYDVPPVRKFCKSLVVDPTRDMEFLVEGLAMNWRGIVGAVGWGNVSRFLQLASAQTTMTLLIVRTMVKSWQMWHTSCQKRTDVNGARR